MSDIGPHTFAFLAELTQHNRDRAWFDANRERYENELLQPMKALIEALEFPLRLMLPDFSGKIRLSRIYQDLRFHKERPLFKRHMWLKIGVGMPAELWFAVGPQGWSLGCKVIGPKKADLLDWRRNLMRFQSRWRAYMKALERSGGVVVEVEEGYRTPLFENIPDDLFELVQTRHAYVEQPRRATFEGPPEAEALAGLARLLPVYFFATLPGSKLTERLEMLNEEIVAPFEFVEPVWEAVKGGETDGVGVVGEPEKIGFQPLRNP